MSPHPAEDRPPPNPSVLDYERPATGALHGRPALSAMAVAAMSVGLLAAGVSFLLGGQVFAYRPPTRLELFSPLIALVGIALSVNALLRIADRKNHLRGDPIAWAALFLNLACAFGSGWCVTLRWMGSVI